MKKTDLKVGMVVKLRCGELHMLMPCGNAKYDLVLFDGNGWLRFNDFEDDLTDKDDTNYDIMKVYGFSHYANQVMSFKTNERELLWERKEEKKKMTVSEIESILGYEVEIISEK